MSTQLDTLDTELGLASGLLGRPPFTSELEAHLPDGRPVLPSGLPDNPLRPGIAAVGERCPASARDDDQVDWIYCADSGVIVAVGLSAVPHEPAHQPSGSE